jgi:hypothetical protein
VVYNALCMDIGSEQEGTPDRELAPLKEKPEHVSTVQIPPVGKIRGKEVRFPMHNSPIADIYTFFQELEDISGISIEGRILNNKSQRDALENHPEFQFLSKTRILMARTEEDMQGYMLHPRFDANGNVITEPKAINYFSQPHSPQSLSSELGYDVGFVPLADVIDKFVGRIGEPAHSMILGCNEFRLGSSRVPQVELDKIASDLAAHIFKKEVEHAKMIAYNGKPHHADYRHLPLTTSYIPQS